MALRAQPTRACVHALVHIAACSAADEPAAPVAPKLHGSLAIIHARCDRKRVLESCVAIASGGGATRSSPRASSPAASDSERPCLHNKGIAAAADFGERDGGRKPRPKQTNDPQCTPSGGQPCEKCSIYNVVQLNLNNKLCYSTNMPTARTASPLSSPALKPQCSHTLVRSQAAHATFQCS